MLRIMGLILIGGSALCVVPSTILVYNLFSVRAHLTMRYNLTVMYLVWGSYITGMATICTFLLALAAGLQAGNARMAWIIIFVAYVLISIWCAVADSLEKSVDEDYLQAQVKQILNDDDNALSAFETAHFCCGVWGPKYHIRYPDDWVKFLPITCFKDRIREWYHILSERCEDKLHQHTGAIMNSFRNLLYILYAIPIILAFYSFIYAWILTIWGRRDNELCQQQENVSFGVPCVTACSPCCVQPGHIAHL